MAKPDETPTKSAPIAAPAPYVCNRAFGAWGKEYNRGDAVDPKDWKGPESEVPKAWANRLRNRDVVTPDELTQIKAEEAENEQAEREGRRSR